MENISFTLTLTSDAEPGSGFGTEILNSIVPTDTNGMPLLPATHIKGIMRDNLLKIAGEIGKPGLRSMILKYFGTESSGKRVPQTTLAFSDLGCIYPAKVSNNERGNKLKNSLLNTISRTKLNENGVAEDGALRTTQVINKGNSFNGYVMINGSSNECLSLLIKLGLLSINAVGGGRNRGCGKCYIEIDNEKRTPGDLLMELYRNLENENIEQNQVIRYSGKNPKKRVLIKMVFEPESPLCIPEYPVVETNSIRSGFTIPASAVQGMILHRINAINKSVADATFESQLFRAWPLFPCFEQEYKLPVRVPLTHLKNKLKDEFWDEFLDNGTKDSRFKKTDGVLIRTEDEIKFWDANEMTRIITAHCVVKKNNLFTVESMYVLKPFIGIVSLPEDAYDLLEFSIGENKYAQFGKARTVRGIGKISISKFNENVLYENSNVQLNFKNRLYIVQSPLLVDEEYLENKPVKANNLLEMMVTHSGWGVVEKAFASTGIIFGWNRSGKGEQVKNDGLLRARVIIKPGSVFLLKKPLENMEKIFEGIGHGRKQGFGAVLPHPGKANSKYVLPEEMNNKNVKSTDEAGEKGYKLWIDSKNSGLSASQINDLRQRLMQDNKSAIEYLHKQKNERPLQIYERWEKIIDFLVQQMKEKPDEIARAMKVWYDLKVAEENENV